MENYNKQRKKAATTEQAEENSTPWIVEMRLKQQGEHFNHFTDYVRGGLQPMCSVLWCRAPVTG